MGYYITPNNEYYEGDRVHLLDNEVPQRPDFTYEWDGSDWVKNSSIDKEIQNKAILQQILDLELKQNRHMREILLGKGDIATNGITPKQRLENLDNEIVALRLQLK